MDKATALKTLSAPSRGRADLVRWRTACDALVDQAAELTGSKAEIATLTGVLKDRDSYLRLSAATVLVELARRDKSHASVFLRLLNDPEPAIRAQALVGLGVAGAEYKDHVLPALKELLQLRNPEVVNRVAPELNAFHGSIQETVPLLIEWLTVADISEQAVRGILHYVRLFGGGAGECARRLFDLSKARGWFKRNGRPFFRNSVFNALSTLLGIKSLYINYEPYHSFDRAIEDLAARGLVKKSVEGGSKKERDEQESLRPELEAIVNSIPVDASFDDAVEALVKLGHDFRAAVARRIQPLLNEQLKRMPQESYADKQAISSWVNAQLRSVGLAVKCPKTGRPGNLVADKKAPDSDISRFRIEIRDEHGKKARPFSARQLPALELMEDEPRREPLLSWVERTRQKTGARTIE